MTTPIAERILVLLERRAEEMIYSAQLKSSPSESVGILMTFRVIVKVKKSAWLGLSRTFVGSLRCNDEMIFLESCWLLL